MPFALAEPNYWGAGATNDRSDRGRNLGQIRVKRDIDYASTGNSRHRLDLFLPSTPLSSKLPVIVLIHGGGWAYGDKTDGAERLIPMVRSGHYAAASIRYRFSDEATWPAQLHDAKAAIRWIRANATTFGIAPDRIGVWGHSAGGHLALMLGVTGDVPALEGDLGRNLAVSSEITAVANHYGVADLLEMTRQRTTLDRRKADAPEARLIGGALLENQEKAKAASPITYISRADAPVISIHGTADHVVHHDQSVLLHEALTSAGVPSYLISVKGGDHGDFGASADQRVLAFFDRYLRGLSVRIPTDDITEWPGRKRVDTHASRSQQTPGISLHMSVADQP